MPSLSGTFGAGLTGNASGKCFCNGQIASTAGSCIRGLACCVGLRLIGLALSAFWGSFSARRRSRSSANCSKPIVLFTARRLIAGYKDIPCNAWEQLRQDESQRFRNPAAAGRAKTVGGESSQQMEVIQQLQSLLNSGYSIFVAVVATLTVLLKMLTQIVKAMNWHDKHFVRKRFSRLKDIRAEATSPRLVRYLDDAIELEMFRIASGRGLHPPPGRGVSDRTGGHRSAAHVDLGAAAVRISDTARK
nr:hypothetical protein [Tanacetum cinerariifolium]